MSNKFTLAYPRKPFTRNQAFGNDPSYYSKFHDSFGNPLKGHNGVDIYGKHGDPVYAAHTGTIHFERDAHGGEGLWLRSNEAFDYPTSTGNAYFTTNYWHLVGDTDSKYPSPIPLDGKDYPVKGGDLIGYTNNTGAPYESSGDHLHFGLHTSDVNGIIYNRDNGFDGRINPELYWNGIYAQDLQTWTDYTKQLIAVLQKLVEYYQSIKKK